MRLSKFDSIPVACQKLPRLSSASIQHQTFRHQQPHGRASCQSVCSPPPTTSHSSQAPAMRNTLLSLEHAILFHVSVPCICFPFSHHPENSCFAFKAQLHVGYCKSSPVHPKLQVSPAFQKFAFHHFVYRRPTLVPVFANQEESEGDFHFYKTRQKAKTTFSV